MQFLPPAASEAGHRVVLYGPGGIGKTSLACMAPGPVAIADLDESLAVLHGQLPGELDIRLIPGITGYQALRDALQAPGWDEIRTIVIDSATAAEELAVRWVLENIPHEKTKQLVQRIEDYGWGKGYTHVYAEFLKLLGDLDQHVRAGRNAILICHDCTANVPNPKGEDYIRYEPRLQTQTSGKASIRRCVREWADHVLFIGYDVEASGGKGQGSGTRTVYPCELPHCMAKSRTADQEIPLAKHDTAPWAAIGMV